MRRVVNILRTISRITILTLLIVLLTAQIMLYFFAKPLLWNYLSRKFDEKTNRLYNLSIDRLRINLFTSSVYVTKVQLKPNLQFFSQQTKSKTIYQFSADTLKINLFNYAALIPSSKSLILQKIYVAKPNLKLFSYYFEHDTIVLEDKKIDYKEVKQTVLDVLLNTFDNILMRKIVVSQGDFSFLSSKNKSSFTTEKISLNINNLETNKKLYETNPLKFRYKSLELVLFDYVLYLNDTIHRLKADFVKFNTSKKEIFVHQFSVSPINKQRTKGNFIDISIQNATFVYDNLDSLVFSKTFHIYKAYISKLSANVFAEKKKSKPKNVVDLKDKLDIYRLFNKFYDRIVIDSFDLSNANIKIFRNKQKADVIIDDLNIYANNLLVDEHSLLDTSRFFYTRQFAATANYVRISHGNKPMALLISGLEANSYTKAFKFGKIIFTNTANSHIKAQIDSIEFVDFNYVQFFTHNNLILDKILAKRIDIAIDLKSAKNDTNRNAVAFNQLINKVYINRISIKSGKIVARSVSGKKTFEFHSLLKIDSRNIIFDPQVTKITKKANINQIDILFTKLDFVSNDSLYKINADTLNYSSHSKLIRLANFAIVPLKENQTEILQKKLISSIIKLHIPQLVITKSNLNQSLLLDSLYFSKLLLKDANLQISFYPQFRVQNQDKQLADSLEKIKTVHYLKLYSQYETFDFRRLSDFLYRKKIMDTLIVVSKNYLTKLNKNQFKILLDTLHSNLNFVCNTSQVINLDNQLYLFNEFANNLVSQHDNKLNVDDVFKIISIFFPRIKSDSIEAQKFSIRIIQNQDNLQTPILNSTADFLFCNFNFDIDSLTNTNSILFSKSFKFLFRDTYVKPPKSPFSVFCDVVDISSQNKSIALTNFRLLETNNTKQTIEEFFVRDIRFDDFDFLRLYNNNEFACKTINAENSRIVLNLGSTPTKQNKVSPKLKLPTIVFSNFFFKNADLQIGFNQNITLTAKSQLTVKNFRTDTTNIQLWSVDNIIAMLENTKFKIANVASVTADSCIATYPDNSLLLYNTTALIIRDSLDFISFHNKLFSLQNFDINQLTEQKNIVVDTIYIKDTKLKLLNKPKTSVNNKLNLADIDLSQKIKPYNSIKVKNILIDDFLLKLPTSDSIRLSKLNIEGLFIDTTTQMTTPNLFYSQNISFVLPRHSRIIADSTYSVSFDQLSGSLHSGILKIENFQYQPTVDFAKFQERFRLKFPYRTTPISVFANAIYSTDFDYKNLIFNRTINSRLIYIDSLMLNAYMDRNYPHNNTLRRTNLSQKILSLPFPINIASLKIDNFNAKYLEVAPKINKIAYVSIDKTKLNVFNIINDTSKIDTYNNLFYIESSGKLNNNADFRINVYYDLLQKGKYAKVTGDFKSFDITTLNTYTIYGASARFDRGLVSRVNFDFDIYDTISFGKLYMEYSNLWTSLMNVDTSLIKRRKFVSWIVNNFVIRRNNPQLGYANTGIIAYIHDPTYSEFKQWSRSILSGVQSTVVFNPRDYRKVRKIMKQKLEQLDNND